MELTGALFVRRAGPLIVEPGLLLARFVRRAEATGPLPPRVTPEGGCIAPFGPGRQFGIESPGELGARSLKPVDQRKPPREPQQRTCRGEGQGGHPALPGELAGKKSSPTSSGGSWDQLEHSSPGRVRPDRREEELQAPRKQGPELAGVSFCPP